MRPHLSNGSLAEQHQLDAAAGFGLRGCVRHCVEIMCMSRGLAETCVGIKLLGLCRVSCYSTKAQYVTDSEAGGASKCLVVDGNLADALQGLSRHCQALLDYALIGRLPSSIPCAHRERPQHQHS